MSDGRLDETLYKLSGGRDKSCVIICSCGVSFLVLASVKGMCCLCFIGVKKVVEYFFIMLALCKD